MRLLKTAALIFIGVSSNIATAALTLTTTEPDVVVYSGPGEQFRALRVLPNKQEIKASSTIVSSASGRFYRVVVQLGPNQKSIGFIAITAAIKVGAENDEDSDDLTKYGAVALVSKAVQFTYASFKDKNYAFTLGYVHYLSPGFYIKGFAGQWAAPLANAALAGAEIGNDALLVGSVSGFVSYSAGIFAPDSQGAIFAGSTSLNTLMLAALGLRYNLEGIASVAIGLTQGAAYNQNNSMISTGIQASLEVGL